ncbi:hypothetical protein [Alcaligenes sp. WGS1538]|uniref:hypothetical protein n=1 Tax=Alcaligenes sp. WGS1538 TaxID=3366811 RepID=UPI00372D5239
MIGFTRSQTDCDGHVCQGRHWANSWACHSCPILLHSVIEESVELNLIVAGLEIKKYLNQKQAISMLFRQTEISARPFALFGGHVLNNCVELARIKAAAGFARKIVSRSGLRQRSPRTARQAQTHQHEPDKKHA